MGSPQAPLALVRFGVFEADLRAGELRRNGVRVRLQDLPFRALTLFLTRPGEVITREEFRQALWPSDVFVDFEQGISSAVMRLRDALGDSADNPIFIQTIERRGYRWIGPILSQTLEPVVQDRAPAPAAAEPESRDFTARYEIGLTTHAQKRGSQVGLWLAVVVQVVEVGRLVVLQFVVPAFDSPDVRPVRRGRMIRTEKIERDRKSVV